MKYQQSRLLQACNVLSEFLLLVVTFLLAGIIRTVLPVGELYFMIDTYMFLPWSVIYAGTIVCVYSVVGAYQQIEYPVFMCKDDGYSSRIGIVNECIRTAIIHVMGLAIVSTLLFAFRMTQVSRLLLAIFYILSIFSVLLKRWLVTEWSMQYRIKHNAVVSVLLVGAGQNAQRFYEKIVVKPNSLMKFQGYLAEEPYFSMPHYLGTLDNIINVLAQDSVDKIVYADDKQDIETINKWIFLCGETACPE